MGKAKKAKKKTPYSGGDYLLVLTTLGIMIFGVTMVFSASYYYSINDTGNPYAFLIKTVAWDFLGVIAMLFMAGFDYHRLKKIAPAFMAVSIFLLCMVFTPLGVEINYATRWIRIGSAAHGFTFMPGEAAKPAVILFTAWFLCKNPAKIKSFSQGVLPLMLLAGVCGGLIVMQPNLSTAITVCIIIFGMMFAAGVKLIYFGGLAGMGGLAVLSLILFNPDSHWNKRLTSFMDPFADPLNTGYQVCQSLLALGSGGLFGRGLGKSIQKNLYLPEPQNDFIFAIIGEELGYVRCLLLIMAYMVLVWRAIEIAVNAKDLFGSLLASGIGIMIGIQVILNIAVVTSSMPPTGVILPLVSYGGNATIIFLGCIGVLLNISRYAGKEGRKVVVREKINTAMGRLR